MRVWDPHVFYTGLTPEHQNPGMTPALILNLICIPLPDLTMERAKCDMFWTSTLPLSHRS